MMKKALLFILVFGTCGFLYISAQDTVNRYDPWYSLPSDYEEPIDDYNILYFGREC